MKAFVSVLVLAVAVYFGYDSLAGKRRAVNSLATTEAQAAQADVLRAAFQNRSSNLQVSGEGEVVKLLEDDDDGRRHQRFIVKVGSGQTLLVAHNIDLAPRIDNLKTGDRVAFHGVYEWNPKGGVVHWTHHDPAGEHEAGWLEHLGRLYQ